MVGQWPQWPRWFGPGPSDFSASGLYYSASSGQIVFYVGTHQGPGIPVDHLTGLRMALHLRLDPQLARHNVEMMLQNARLDLTPCTWLIREEP